MSNDELRKLRARLNQSAAAYKRQLNKEAKPNRTCYWLEQIILKYSGELKRKPILPVINKVLDDVASD